MSIRLYITAAVGLLACLSAAAQKFDATGNADPDHRAPANKAGEVVVTFDTMPVKMSFDLPGHIKMITENGIPYTNGATETYIPAEGFHEGASYESWNDKQNVYSRMWIESRNDARIVVRHRCALVKQAGSKLKIVHSDKGKVAPYGPGNWVDEWYIIHPDGTHTRRIKIWNKFARQSGFHGAPYPYELEGMYLWWGAMCTGKMAADHLEDGVITLIQMDGRHRTFDFTPYPMDTDPKAGHETMFTAYRKFKHANIHVVNTKSEYRPWRIGRPSKPGGTFNGQTLWMSPYKPVHELVQLVPCFPPGSTRATGYSVAGLGQMIYSDYWKLTDTTMEEIWLNGFTANREPAEELSRLARSWLQAPALSVTGGGSAQGYSVGDRAYLLGADRSQTTQIRVAASKESPVVNPVFLVNNWGSTDAELIVDGKPIKRGLDFRLGHYNSLERADGSTWQNVLAVWVKVTSTRPIQFSIKPAGVGPAPAAPTAVADGYRTWTDRKGTTLDAKLIKDTNGTVTLRKKNGQTIRVPRTRLSPSDILHLDTRNPR